MTRGSENGLKPQAAEPRRETYCFESQPPLEGTTNERTNERGGQGGWFGWVGEWVGSDGRSRHELSNNFQREYAAMISPRGNCRDAAGAAVGVERINW